MKFSSKLCALFSAIILIMGTGISFFVYSSNVKTLETHIEDRLKNQAFHTIDKIDMMVFERYEDIKAISSDHVISSRSATIEQLTHRLIEFRDDRGYDSLAFYDLNKTCIADTSGRNIGEKHSSPEIWRGLEEGRDIFMAVVKSDFLKKVILRFTSVVKNRQGNTLGFVVSRVPVENLHAIVRQAVGIYNVEKDFEVELINENGLLLYSMYPEEILKEESADWDAIKALRSKGLTTGTLKFTNPKEKTGEELLVFASEKGYRGFKGNGWTLKVEVPTKVAFASAVELRNRILVISLLISFFAFVIARFFSGRISKPIERLSAASEEVAKGNLDVKVDVTSNDETGKLADAFNRMTSDLKEQRDKLLSYSSELEARILEQTSELREANELLKKREAGLATAQRIAKLGNWESDMKSGNIFWSDEMYRIYGFADERFKPTFEIFLSRVHPEDRAFVSGAVEAALRDNKPFGGDFRIVLPDGTVRYMHAEEELIFDDSGKPAGLRGITQDITERKQMEKALKDYSETLEEKVKERTRELVSANTELKKIFNAIEQSTESVIITDINGTIQYVNPAFTRVAGYSKADAIGKNPNIIKSGKNPPEMYNELWGTIMSGSMWRGTTINKKKSGELYYEEMTITPVLDEHGEIINFVAIKKDITDRVKAEEELRQKNVELEAAKDMAEAANIAKSEFLANMSHELRTPLNAVIGFSQVILDGMAGPVTGEQRDFVKDIHESGQHLLSLISDILELSSIETGETEPVLKELDIRPLLEDSVALFREKATNHNISATIDVAEGVKNVTADKRFIKQIIVSLLSNAFKFTPDGGSVHVQARKIHDAGYTMQNKEKGFNIVHPESGIVHPGRDFIEISVADTGIGIAKEDMERLFVPFKQLEPHLTKKYGGAGVGLYLAQRLVEMHNGKIWAESEAGKGSKFIFAIPIIQGQGASSKGQGKT